MKQRDRDADGGNTAQEVGVAGGSTVQKSLYRREPPGEYEQRKQNPGHPGFEPAAAGMDAAVGMLGGACGGVFMLEGADGGRLPELEQNDERQDRDDGGADGRERGSDVVADGELRRAKGDAYRETGGPDLHHVLAPAHGPHHPEGNGDREQHEDAAG